MNEKMKIIVIIPAYNEEKTIRDVLQKAKKYVTKVVVIDDASSDSTHQIAIKEDAIVYRHSINRGLGGALGTGIKVALKENADIAVTLDADGQHDPSEISRLIQPIIDNKADVVIGSRFLRNQKVPIRRKIYNKIGNIITYLLFSVKTSDSQSGFRALNHKALELLKIKTNKMEVSSEIMKEIGKNNLRFMEVPIKAIYTEYSLSKGQSFFTGLRTLFKLIILKLSK